MEEFFLHLWDELDDLVGICRHVATVTAAEMVAASAPLALAWSSRSVLGSGDWPLAMRCWGRSRWWVLRRWWMRGW